MAMIVRKTLEQKGRIVEQEYGMIREDLELKEYVIDKEELDTEGLCHKHGNNLSAEGLCHKHGNNWSAQGICPRQGKNLSAEGICRKQGKNLSAEGICPRQGKNLSAEGICPRQGKNWRAKEYVMDELKRCGGVYEFPEEAVEKLFSVKWVHGQNEPRIQEDQSLDGRTVQVKMLDMGKNEG